MFVLGTLVLVFFAGALPCRVEGATSYVHYRKHNTVLSACSQVSAAMGTYCEDEADKFSCYCKNVNAVATTVGCIDLVFGLDNEMRNIYSQQCEGYYAVAIQPEDFDIALETYYKEAKNVSILPNFNKSLPVHHPILVNETLARMYEEAYDIFLGKGWELSLYYGAALLAYWLVIIIGAFFLNWGKILFPEYFARQKSKFYGFLKKQITIPAIHKSYHASKKFGPLLTMTIPSRSETIIIGGFLILTVSFQAADIRIIDDTEFTIKMKYLVLRMLGIRSSFLASYLTPLLILFSGRSNFLQWITRWNYATFIVFHKWISRIVILLVLIHSICYSLYYGAMGTYAATMKQNYMIWGIVGTTAVSLMLVQGMNYLRNRWYEVFLLVHIILAAIFIAASWIHVQTLGFVFWYYAAAAVWVFDRAVRLSLLASFGCPYASVTLLADETLKVVVPRPYHWQFNPGSHAYVHFIRPSCFWQSHPFTIARSFVNDKNLVFHCKVKGGVTHGLYQYLKTCRNQSAQIRVCVEGPYGETGEIKSTQSAIFVASGHGIPGIYSEAMDLVTRGDVEAKKYVKLIWVVPEYKSLCWFYPELLKMKDTNIDAIIYVTNPNKVPLLDDFEKRFTNGMGFAEDELLIKGTLDDEKGYNIISSIHKELPHIEFKEGRPDINDLVAKEIAMSHGNTVFVTCGHPQMVDDIRYAVSQRLTYSNACKIDLKDRLQTWT